jgi:hypothetical protein
MKMILRSRLCMPHADVLGHDFLFMFLDLEHTGNLHLACLHVCIKLLRALSAGTRTLLCLEYHRYVHYSGQRMVR